MDVVGETDEGDIIGNAQAQLLDAREGGKSNDVVEGKNGLVAGTGT